jgi:transcriptional regulator with XRE-family HTH domain
VVQSPAQTAGRSPEIGARLRRVRKRRNFTLRQVADQAGVSSSFLSQVERGRTGVSLNALQRVAAVLGVTMADLFTAEDGPESYFLQRQDRPVLAFGPLRKFLLSLRTSENLEVLVGEFEPGASTGDEPYSHGDSEEVCLVISGSISALIDGQPFELAAGDTLRYRSSAKHFFRNAGAGAAEVVWIVSPPSY